MVSRGHIDLTKPSAGRIQDHLLGGTHNFEIDRLMASRLKKIAPIMMENVFAQRDLLGRGVTYFVRELGLKQIIDFGSSLPTCNNTHQVAHAIDPSVRIIYSDIDLLTVRYSREILVNVANVHYLWCDAAQPETVLGSVEAKEFFGDDHRVGICFTLLAHFMKSVDLKHAARTLYEWADPGSHMIVLSMGGSEWLSDPILQEILAQNEKMGIDLKLRNLDELLSMFAPWEVTEHGVANNYSWGLPPDAPRSHRPTRAWSFMLHKK
ncbi:MAG: hypothetical protein GXP41_11360 [Chloroflexi bacterium]|nr:hypothetical protein [Chloroflexota bacterium]